MTVNYANEDQIVALEEAVELIAQAVEILDAPDVLDDSAKRYVMPALQGQEGGWLGEHVVDYATEDFTRRDGRYDLIVDIPGNPLPTVSTAGKCLRFLRLPRPARLPAVAPGAGTVMSLAADWRESWAADRRTGRTERRSLPSPGVGCALSRPQREGSRSLRLDRHLSGLA